MSPATESRSPAGGKSCAIPQLCVTPALLPRKNWSSSWTVLEGGILTFFKDSKHSAASALVRAPVALGQGSSHRMEPVSMGQGQYLWDSASTHGTGPDWTRTQRMQPTCVGWGQHPQGTRRWPHLWGGGSGLCLVGAEALGEGGPWPAPTEWGQHPQDRTSICRTGQGSTGRG